MKVGVAGLGRMGSAIAKRLIEVGHEVVVWNRNQDKTKALATRRRRGRRDAERTCRRASRPSSPS